MGSLQVGENLKTSNWKNTVRNLSNHRGPQPLATLKVEKATVDGERRKVEADLGPRSWCRPQSLELTGGEVSL